MNPRAAKFVGACASVFIKHELDRRWFIEDNEFTLNTMEPRQKRDVWEKMKGAEKAEAIRLAAIRRKERGWD